MSYLRAREAVYREDLSYRVYVTDAIQALGDNKHPVDRWIDVVNRKIDTRSADEIAMAVILGAGLRVGGDKS